jgi:hypothetical protein
MYEHVMKSQTKECNQHQLLVGRGGSTSTKLKEPDSLKPLMQMKYPEFVSPLEDVIKLQKVVNDPKLTLVQVKEIIGKIGSHRKKQRRTPITGTSVSV